MSIFDQESGLALCLWILGSIVLAVALLLLSVFEGKRDELRECLLYPDGSITAMIADCMTAPQERLKNLESKISTKSNKLEINQEKIEETKRTISELEVTSGEVQVKYQEMLKQLKSELSRTEAECQHLHDQIEKITTTRDKLKRELSDVGSQFKLASKTQSSLTFVEDKMYPCDTMVNKGFDCNVNYNQKKPQNRSSGQARFSPIAMEGAESGK